MAYDPNYTPDLRSLSSFISSNAERSVPENYMFSENLGGFYDPNEVAKLVATNNFGTRGSQYFDENGRGYMTLPPNWRDYLGNPNGSLMAGAAPYVEADPGNPGYYRAPVIEGVTWQPSQAAGSFMSDYGPLLLMAPALAGVIGAAAAGAGAGGAAGAGAGAAGATTAAGGGAAELASLAGLEGFGGVGSMIPAAVDVIPGLAGAASGIGSGVGQVVDTVNELGNTLGGQVNTVTGQALPSVGSGLNLNQVLSGAQQAAGALGGAAGGSGASSTGGGSGGFDWTGFLGNSLGSGLTGLLNYRTAQDMMGIGAPFRTAAQQMVTDPNSWYSGPLGQATTRAVMQGRSAMAPGGTQDIMNAAGALGAYNQHLGTLGALGGLGLNQGAQFQANFNQLPNQIAGAAGAASQPSQNDWMNLFRQATGQTGLSGLLGGTNSNASGTNIGGADDYINWARNNDWFSLT